MRLTILLLFLSGFSYGQKFGLNYPILSKADAIKQKYILCDNQDTLIKYVRLSGSKIFISGSFTIAVRCTVSGSNVIVEGDKKAVITSTYWGAPYRLAETFLITGKNVTFRGLKLRGTSDNILTLDYRYFQEGIRVYADSCKIINCELTDWDFAALYLHRFNGCLIDNCYISRNKRSGFGYCIWCEGTKDMTVTVTNNFLFDSREAFDAGGNQNNFIITGNVTDQSVGSHINPQKFAGKNVTATGNYCVGDHGIGFPYPADTTGSVTITGNYFLVDTFQMLGTKKNGAKVDTSGNFFNGQGMNLPVCSLRLDSVYLWNGKWNARLTMLSAYKNCEINFGDGTQTIPINAGSIVHQYLIDGSYTVSLRCFDVRCIPSLWVTKKVVIGNTKGISFAFKTSARFLPIQNFYKIQFLIKDSVVSTFESHNIWQWKRIFIPFNLAGTYRLSLKIICVQDYPYSIQCWFDDFDMNGQVANSGFEQTRDEWNPPVSYFNHTGGGSIPVKAGIVDEEKCGGAWSYRFEFGGGAKKNTFAELYQYVIVK